MTKRHFRFHPATAAATLVLLTSAPASAYIGPGAGLSAIGSVLAIIGAIFAAIFGFVWYPIKRLLRRRRVASRTADDTTTADDRKG